MGGTHRLIVVALITALLAVAGCKSKQDKPGAGAEVPQGKPAAGAPQGKPAAVSATVQDKLGAHAAAKQVISQLVNGEFAAIYKESAPFFKQIGSESLFVAKFQETRQKVGVLKNPKEISFETRPDAAHVLVYRLENDQYRTDLRLSFARSKSGKMELVGLNQHDELKK